MRKLLHCIVVTLLVSTTSLVGVAYAGTITAAPADSSRVVKSSSAKEVSQRSFLSSLRGALPFRQSGNDNEKLLSNVKVFPNPIVDQISLSYRLSKTSAISIKVMDALGNEVMTLFQQEQDAGPQSHVFDIANKLTNGFYFIRVTAGTETVIKRISVL